MSCVSVNFDLAPALQQCAVTEGGREGSNELILLERAFRCTMASPDENKFQAGNFLCSVLELLFDVTPLHNSFPHILHAQRSCSFVRFKKRFNEAAAVMIFEAEKRNKASNLRSNHVMDFIIDGADLLSASLLHCEKALGASSLCLSR